jgi:hypothetical protein
MIADMLMIGRIVTAKLFHIVLALALLVGVLPAVNPMLAMPIIYLGVKATQSYMAPGNANARSSGSCCDAMGSASPVCDFMVSQLVRIMLYGDSQQVLSSNFVVQSIYLKTLGPPPKA